jgi:hypothetical protein
MPHLHWLTRALNNQRCTQVKVQHRCLESATESGIAGKAWIGIESANYLNFLHCPFIL